MSRLIIKYKSCIILLLEEIEVENRKELEITERAYIETYICVNKMIPGRTAKEYRKDNKVEIAERMKEYRTDNKVKLTEYRKKRHQLNKERLNEESIKYNQENKVELAKKRKEKNIKYTCEC